MVGLRTVYRIESLLNKRLPDALRDLIFLRTPRTRSIVLYKTYYKIKMSFEKAGPENSQGQKKSRRIAGIFILSVQNGSF